MVELCIFKEYSNFFPTLTLGIFLYFSELKIPKSFVSSMEAKKVEISPESPTQFGDEILTLNNLYLRIGYISSSQERFKQMTYNYLKKKMLNNLLHTMEKELYHDIPKGHFLFQRTQIPDEMIGSILKHHIEHFYSMEEGTLDYIYNNFVRIYEKIFKLNDIW